MDVQSVEVELFFALVIGIKKFDHQLIHMRPANRPLFCVRCLEPFSGEPHRLSYN
jgi:hypothetical protein